VLAAAAWPIRPDELRSFTVKTAGTDHAALSAFATLSSVRIRLRQWREEDRDAFAAMNSDARVMQFFPGRLSRAESDAMADRIQEHFSQHNFGLWAIEVPHIARFIGFTGLAVPGFTAPFTPCVEVGWRLAFEHWGRGYATEAARLALDYGFGTLALSAVVSFTAVANHRSRAVMERLGMRSNPMENFDHPALPEGHSLRRHVLYRLGRAAYIAARDGFR
jgi:RimJ/RimL family protein N-acetyltransferase